MQKTRGAEFTRASRSIPELGTADTATSDSGDTVGQDIAHKKKSIVVITRIKEKFKLKDAPLPKAAVFQENAQRQQIQETC